MLRIILHIIISVTDDFPQRNSLPSNKPGNILHSFGLSGIANAPSVLATAVKGRPYYVYVNLPIGYDEKKKSTLNRENNVKTYLVRTLSTANLYLEFKRFRNNGHLTRGTHKPSSHKLMKFHI